MVVEEAQRAAGPQRGQASAGGPSSKPRPAAPAPTGGRGPPDQPYDLTVYDLVALLKSSPGGVVDLGGQTVWVGEQGLALSDDKGATISNGTLVGGCVEIQGSRAVGSETRIRLSNLTFRGPGKRHTSTTFVALSNLTRVAGRSDNDGGIIGLTDASLVSVRGGAVGVVIEGCTFVGAEGGSVKRDAQGDFIGPGWLPASALRGASVSCLAAGIHVRDGTVRVENCRFVDNGGPGVWAGCGGDPVAVTVRNSRFSGNVNCDVAASAEGRVELEGCVLESKCRHNLSGMAGGVVHARGTVCRNGVVGAMAEMGGTATLEGCTFDGCPIQAEVGATLTATDVTVTGAPAFGISLRGGAQGTVRGARILASAGILVNASRLVASDVVCRDTLPGLDVPGVVVTGGGVLRLERSTLSKNGAGIGVFGERSTVEASDVELHGNKGHGVSALGGSVTLQGGGISGGVAGLAARGAGTCLTARGVEISRCAMAGVSAEAGAQVTVQGACVTDSGGAGVVARGAGTRVTASRVECARNAGGDYVREEGGSVVVDEDAVME